MLINNSSKIHNKVLDIMRKKEEQERMNCITTKKIDNQFISAVEDIFKFEVGLFMKKYSNKKLPNVFSTILNQFKIIIHTRRV